MAIAPGTAVHLVASGYGGGFSLFVASLPGELQDAITTQLLMAGFDVSSVTVNAGVTVGVLEHQFPYTADIQLRTLVGYDDYAPITQAVQQAVETASGQTASVANLSAGDAPPPAAPSFTSTIALLVVALVVLAVVLHEV